jgi:hypothetical protein
MAERTTITLARDDYNVLDEVRKANGWSVAEAAQRAIHALASFDAQLAAQAAKQKGTFAELIRRVRREVNPALLLQPRPMGRKRLTGGLTGVRFGELTFLEEDGRLFARLERSGHADVYEVGPDGRLILRYSPAPAPEALAELN